MSTWLQSRFVACGFGSKVGFTSWNRLFSQMGPRWAGSGSEPWGPQPTPWPTAAPGGAGRGGGALHRPYCLPSALAAAPAPASSCSCSAAPAPAGGRSSAVPDLRHSAFSIQHQHSAAGSSILKPRISNANAISNNAAPPPPRTPCLVALCQGPGDQARSRSPICEAGGEAQKFLGFYLRGAGGWPSKRGDGGQVF
jgi:hypothetical protein